MHEGCGLQGLTGLLVRQLSGRKFSQLLVHERQELAGGKRIASFDGMHDLGEFIHQTRRQSSPENPGVRPTRQLNVDLPGISVSALA